MYIYTIGYYSWDDSPHMLLQHEKLFTQEEFQDICAESYLRAFEINKNLLTKKSQKQFAFYFKVNSFYDKAIEIMLKSYGFSKIEPQARFCPDGYSNIREEIGSLESPDEDLELLKTKYKEKYHPQ